MSFLLIQLSFHKNDNCIFFIFLLLLNLFTCLLFLETFAEANARLKRLIENQKYIAYSSESDMSSKEKANLIMERLKNKQPSLDFEEIMMVPKLGQMIDKRTEVNSVMDERNNAEILSEGETPNLCSTNFGQTDNWKTTERQNNSQLFDSRKRSHSPRDNASRKYFLLIFYGHLA